MLCQGAKPTLPCDTHGNSCELRRPERLPATAVGVTRPQGSLHTHWVLVLCVAEPLSATAAASVGQG